MDYRPRVPHTAPPSTDDGRRRSDAAAAAVQRRATHRITSEPGPRSPQLGLRDADVVRELTLDADATRDT